MGNFRDYWIGQGLTDRARRVLILINPGVDLQVKTNPDFQGFLDILDFQDIMNFLYNFQDFLESGVGDDLRLKRH